MPKRCLDECDRVQLAMSMAENAPRLLNDEPDDPDEPMTQEYSWCCEPYQMTTVKDRKNGRKCGDCLGWKRVMNKAAFFMRYPRKGDHAVKAALVVRQSDTNTSMTVVIIIS